MKNSMLTLLAILSLSILGIGNAYSDDMQVSEEQMQDIKANCEAEAKEAGNPDDYVKQCIEESLQSLKDNQGNSKDPS